LLRLLTELLIYWYWHYSRVIDAGRT